MDPHHGWYGGPLVSRRKLGLHFFGSGWVSLHLGAAPGSNQKAASRTTARSISRPHCADQTNSLVFYCAHTNSIYSPQRPQAVGVTPVLAKHREARENLDPDSRLSLSRDECAYRDDRRNQTLFCHQIAASGCAALIVVVKTTTMQYELLLVSTKGHGQTTIG